MKLSIIIVNWKVRDFLRACLQSVYDQVLLDRTQWEVLVVDNASKDGSVEMLRREFPGLTVLENDENVGFGRANNQAFAISRGEYVLLLNPDTVVLDHAVDRLLALMEEHPRMGVAGCQLLNSDGTFQRWTGGAAPNLPNIVCHFLFLYRLLPERILPRPLYLESRPSRHAAVGWVSGACMLLRREAANGLFDERFFLYGEDLDLCDRIRRSGWEVIYAPETSIIHHQGQSFISQSWEVKMTKLQGLRTVFASRHGYLSLKIYDTVVGLGFAARTAAYGIAAVANPGRGFEARRTLSQKYALASFRMLLHS